MRKRVLESIYIIFKILHGGGANEFCQGGIGILGGGGIAAIEKPFN